MKYLIAYSYYEEYLETFSKLINDLDEELNFDKVIFVACGLSGLQENKLSKFNKRFKEVILIHDNENWEFGGYQLGIDYISKKIRQGDLVVIANDTVGKHTFLPSGIIKIFTQKSLISMISSMPTVIGEVACAPNRAEWTVSGISIKNWVRSCLFSINYSALNSLKLSVENRSLIDDIVIENGEISFNNVCSFDLHQHIMSWLSNPQSGSQWYRSVDKTDAKYHHLLKNKCSSIIQEKYMSAKIVDVGGELIDILPDKFFDRIIFKIKRKIWHRVIFMKK